MRLIIEPDYQTLSEWTATYIAKKINEHEGEYPFVLGLPTGSSPLGTYNYLIELFQQGKVSFKNVITFNMDEYIGIGSEDPRSFHAFMWQNFFNHIDIQAKNINMLDGLTKNPEAECERYEEKIKALGGIDLFLGGVGPDGHIAFNEPGSSLQSRTRVKTLTYDTILANSRFFNHDPDQVPKTAMTVGVGTVFDSNEVLIIANGHSKARALLHAVEEGINHMWTISILQMHPKGIIVCDEAATYELKVGTYRYFKDIEKNNLSPDSL